METGFGRVPSILSAGERDLEKQTRLRAHRYRWRRRSNSSATARRTHSISLCHVLRSSAHVTGEDAVWRESLHAGGVRCTLAVSSEAPGKTNPRTPTDVDFGRLVWPAGI